MSAFVMLDCAQLQCAMPQSKLCCRESAEAAQRAVHERLVFELLGIRQRFRSGTTRKALDAYQDHRPQPPGKQDGVPMHRAPLRYANRSCVDSS